MVKLSSYMKVLEESSTQTEVAYAIIKLGIKNKKLS